MNFIKNSKILLIGEANFSFAKSLCDMKYCEPEQLTGTCFEREDSLCSMGKKYSEVLKNKGATILYNIDGRKLETYFNESFSYIIFNFPHCGGKMKIQKNRLLLKEFFQSAAKVLSQNGTIYITLCSGQGGTPLDTSVRRWDDTWQIVPMASFGDFILTSVCLFDPHTFRGYVSSGYRSLEKSFHQNGSLLYKFAKSSFRLPITMNSSDYASLQLSDKSTVRIPSFFNSLVQRNIFKETGGFIQFTFNYIVNILKTSFYTCIQDSSIGVLQNDIIISSNFNTRKCIFNQNEVLVYPILHIASNEIIPICGICSCESMKTLLQKFINMKFSLNVLNTSKSWVPYWKTFSFHPSFHEKINVKGQQPILMYSIDLKKLSSFLFDLKNHELWNYGVNVHMSANDVVVYQPCSLFPPVYNFHLSFWVPDEAKSNIQAYHTNVNIIIVNTVQDSLLNFSLLGSYNDVNDRISETYEIVYCSLDKALSHDKAKEMHEEVGKRLQLYLNCNIR